MPRLHNAPVKPLLRGVFPFREATVPVPSGLADNITDALRQLRFWRDIGDESQVQRLNDRINALLDRVQRLEKV